MESELDNINQSPDDIMISSVQEPYECPITRAHFDFTKMCITLNKLRIERNQQQTSSSGIRKYKSSHNVNCLDQSQGRIHPIKAVLSQLPQASPLSASNISRNLQGMGPIANKFPMVKLAAKNDHLPLQNLLHPIVSPKINSNHNLVPLDIVSEHDEQILRMTKRTHIRQNVRIQHEKSTSFPINKSNSPSAFSPLSQHKPVFGFQAFKNDLSPRFG